jgi:hypothetical protein
MGELLEVPFIFYNDALPQRRPLLRIHAPAALIRPCTAQGAKKNQEIPAWFPLFPDFRRFWAVLCASAAKAI